MHRSVENLLDATRALLMAKADALSLTREDVASIRPVREVTPTHLPVLKLMPTILPEAGSATRAVVEALIAAAPHLHWRQTYSEEDGFDRSYLDRYGWLDLAGPEGPCEADGIRVMMGYWGKGLLYPSHSHPPEEHYLVLAGGAKFRLGDEPYRRLGPGEVFHTPPGAVHSADMRDEALMAISIWRGEDTGVRINLTDQDRDVVKT